LARHESADIAALDDIAAALDRQREAIAIVAARQRSSLSREDYNELREVLEAAEVIRERVADLRQKASKQYQQGQVYATTKV
jgi:hypothetical protein